MNENTKTNGVIAYEYKEVKVPHTMKDTYVDGYKNFGWEFCSSGLTWEGGTIELKFRRDRRLKNQSELRSLENQFENGIKEIQKIERKKTIEVMSVVFGVGLVGVGFLVGSIFSFIGGLIPLGIILFVPTLACWGLGYLSSIKLQTKKGEKAAPHIDSQYDTIYDVCEKANALLVAAAN